MLAEVVAPRNLEFIRHVIDGDDGAAGLEAVIVGQLVVANQGNKNTDSRRRMNTANYVEASQAGVTVAALTADAIAEALFAAEGMPTERWHAMSDKSNCMAIEISDWTRVAGSLNNLYRQP